MDTPSDFAFFFFTPEHPRLFYILTGVGISLLAVPIVECITARREYQRFFDTFRGESMARARSELFNGLGHAYETWKKTQTESKELPISIEELIEETPFPSWLPVLDEPLIDAIKREFHSNPPPLWKLARDLYKEIDDYLKGRGDLTLLPVEDVKEFHFARQRLTYFWNDAGNLIFRDRKLRYRNVERDVRNDERLLKALTFIELGLHLANRQRGHGSCGHHYLLSVYFKNKKWGLKEFVKNPTPLKGY